jgi:hypothetical protein
MSFISSRVARGLGLAVALLTCLVLPVSTLSPAGAANPPGSAIEVFLELGSTATPGDPAHAIGDGWWGREGAARNDSTLFSADIRDGGTAFLDIFGDWSNVGVAFVPTSADGSAEHPTVTAGELAGNAFHWYSDLGAFGSAVYSSTSNKGVDGLWTQAGKDQWVADGKPSTAFNDNLVQTLPLVTGNPVAAHQYQTSILNTWPAGTDVSLVYFQIDSVNANNEPTVKVGPDGHAVTAWMPFTTVASTTRPTVETSAGYHVSGAKTTPTVSLAESWTAGAGTLTATVSTGTGTATDATGTVQFETVTGGTATPSGAPVTVTNGKATMSLAGVATGTVFQATYTPDSAASSTYDPATSGRRTILGEQAQTQSTTTTLTVGGAMRAGATQTLTASVSPASAAGTITFKDGARSLGATAVRSGRATKPIALAVGRHSLTAVFTPSSPATYTGSTSTSRVVTVAKASSSITTALAPKKVKKGKKAKLTVTVRAAGVTATGTVQVTVKPQKGKAKTVTATVVRGVAKVTLPKAAKGTTKVTVRYLGSSTLLASSRSLSFKVT